jgi:hypothetical protein
MIEPIKDLPSNMVGFRSTGEVTKDDFEVVMDEVKKLVDRTGKLNYLFFLDNSPKDFTAGAWMQDALLGLRNLTKWNRAAIVTDSDAVIKFTDIFSAMMPGEFKGFHKSDYTHAVDWVSEKVEA